MQALILVGGEGTRLRPLTSTVPKPVVTLVDRPFMAYMLEWLRRHDPALDRQLRKFLFTTTEPITEVGADGDESPDAVGSGSLGIGSLKGVER